MRSMSFLLCLSVLSLALACAAEPPSTVDSMGPVTQSGTSILILPFSSPPGNDLYHWVGPAIQHVTAADVSHGSGVLNVLAPASLQPAADADAALVAGKSSGASFVVFGETQLIEREVRITGEVMDVSAGRSIGGLKATGKLDDLFHLEDAIGSQVLAALPASLRQEQSAQTTAPEQPSTGQSQVQSQPYASGPAISDNGGYYSSGYTYPSSGYAYSYPSYDYYPSYSYPYYPYSYYYPYGLYGSFYFNNGHDHHDDHHDGHHDDFHNGHNDGHGDGHGDFSHGWSGSGWSGSSSGRNFTGANGSPGVNRSTFGMNSSPAMRGGGFQSAPSNAGGFSRGSSGAGMSRGFSGAGMSRGFSGGGMSHGGFGGGGGGGMHGGGGGGGHR